MKTLYESILDDQDVLVNNASKHVEDMDKWYKSWEKFDKEFWDECLKIIEKEGHVDRDKIIIQTIKERHGGITNSKYMVNYIYHQIDSRYQLTIKKAISNLVKKLCMKHFARRMDLFGNAAALRNADIIVWKITHPYVGQDILKQLNIGNVKFKRGYIYVEMKRFIR